VDNNMTEYGKDKAMNTDLTILTFNSPTGADTMLQTFKDLQDDNFIELEDAVIVTKDATGKVQLRQPLVVTPGQGAAFGAVTGAIVGLIGGPGGAIVGLVSGAVTGGATAAAWEADLPQDEIKAMAVDNLRPNQSALIVYVDEIWLDQIDQAAEDIALDIKSHIVREQRKADREKAAELRKEKIDAAYKSWQAKLDAQRASVTALRQQIANSMKADQAAIQKKLDSANTAIHTTYKNILQTLAAWQRQIDGRIEELRAEAQKANAEAKADVQKRLASAQEAQATLRANVKATLTARLNTLKADIEHLKAQAAKAQGEAKTKLDQRVAKLEADWEAEQKRLDQLDKAEGEAWDQMVRAIEDAFDTYDTSVNEAETEYAKKA
jgi:uncharacterized membrane protein